MADTKTKITDSTLVALIDNELRQSFGYGDGKLEQLRRRNMYFFMAEAKEELAPPAIEGRSKVVDTLVRDTVLGMHGPLMKTFHGSDNVFEFEETRPEDAPKAKLISEYVNHIFRNTNPGYQIASDWIFEALAIKSGILKVWWDNSDIETAEEYSGLTIEQLTMLLDDDELELTGQEEYDDEDAAKQKGKALDQLTAALSQIGVDAARNPQGGQQFAQVQQQMAAIEAQPVPKLYDVTAKRSKAGGRVRIENVPPEEFLISKKAKSIKTAPFVAHRFPRLIADLRAEGYDLPDTVASDDAGAERSMERAQRLDYLDDTGYRTDLDEEGVDESMRSVWVVEAYIQMDYDRDGIPEWRKIVKCGTLILENEEFDEPPFVALGSIPLPHQFYGLCPADLAIEYQKIKTSLTRAQLDNIYLQINRRQQVAPGVNLDDLLNSTPGGVVRVNAPGLIAPIEQGMGDGGQALALTEYFEQRAEESTGWTRQTQGGDGNRLQPQTATQANIVTNRADMRIESISRNMAETGFTDLGYMILKLVQKYQRKAEMVKIAGGWVNIDPREWTNRFSLSVNVGLGTGNKDQLVQHLMMLNQQQLNGLQLGYATPAGLYAGAKRMANALGFKNADEFFTDPAKAPPQQQRPDPEMMKLEAQQQQFQAKLQADMQTAQMQAQFDVQKAQLQAEAQIRVDQAREQAQIQQHGMKLQQEAELAAMKAQYEAQNRADDMAFAQWKIERELDGKIVLAQIAAKQKNDASLAAAEQQSNEDMSQ